MINTKFTRRALSLAIVGGFTAINLPVLAQTGATPVEGKQYRTLARRNPTSVSDKKIEVIEFFWYGCPHCNALDPALEAWLKKAPADVSFKRVHINFGTPASPNKHTDAHQRLFYTLETLGLNATQNTAVFTAIHADHKKLESREGILEWAKSRNLDMAKFTATFDDAFTMMRKQSAATQLQEAYKVDGVPYFGIDGQFVTSPSIAGSESTFFSTLEFLISKARKDRTPVAAFAVEKKSPISAVKSTIKPH
jgi:protein dithiol oxidoreductase (disulfide-forming)